MDISDPPIHLLLAHSGNLPLDAMKNIVIENVLKYDSPKKKKKQLPDGETTRIENLVHPTKESCWLKYPAPKRRTCVPMLLKMLRKNVGPNMIVVVDGKHFHCHSMVMRVISRYFRWLRHSNVLHLPIAKVTPLAFIALYRWALDPRYKINYLSLIEVFRAAEFLQIDPLVSICWMLLENHGQTDDRALFLYHFANDKGIFFDESLFARVSRIFLTYVSTKEFQELRPDVVSKLLSRGTLAVNTEMEVLMSAVVWLMYDWSARQQYALELMQCVRYELLPYTFLMTFIKRRDCQVMEYLSQCKEIRHMVYDLLVIRLKDPHRYQGRNNVDFRYWIYDAKCPYHHCYGCQSKLYLNYQTFLAYLETLQTVGPDHWRSIPEYDKPGLVCCKSISKRKKKRKNI